MTDQFTIQCQSCGTLYNDLQEVCPYCGEPQPSTIEDPFLEGPSLEGPSPEDPFLPDEHLAPDLPETEEDVYFDESTESAVDETPPQGVYPIPTHQLLDKTYTPQETPVPDEPYPVTESSFTDDDIFAVVGQDDGVNEVYYPDELDEVNEFEDEYAEYPDEHVASYNELDDYEYDEPGAYIEPEDYLVEDEIDETPVKRRFRFRQIAFGCLGFLICLGLFYSGIGIVAVRQGLQERSQNTLVESRQHYQKGQEYLTTNSIELAIAEFERAITLDPNWLEARQALREAQRIAQSQPTPTSQTRSAAVTEFFAQAETQIDQQNWAEAAQTLSQVRGVDPDFQPEQISEMLYTTYYQMGLQMVESERLEDALAAFEQAVAERPENIDAAEEQTKTSLYLDGVAAEQVDLEQAIEIFDQLYQLDKNYLDVEQHLWRAYEFYGDELVKDKTWCKAETQYLEANTIQSGSTLAAKAKNAGENCAGKPATPTATASVSSGSGTAKQATSTPASSASPSEVTSTDTAETEQEEAEESDEEIVAGPVSGHIFYSIYNPNESRWEIVSIPAGGGSPEVIVTDATMPAVSPNGELLLYHSELIDTEGFHIFNLTTGEDKRITKQKDHILPRWGGDSTQFLFPAQEAGTGRWLVYQGFADGKSDPVTIRDGRTPDWSANGTFIAYQGADAEGNNPGIYLVPFGGGESTRLTEHESDRSPVFSPNNARLAYMSTSSGNWDIYVVSTADSTPRQLTTATGNDGLPAWSPDGSRVAYVSDSDGSWAIYTVDAAGGTPTKITEWDGSNRADWLMGQLWWAK